MNELLVELHGQGVKQHQNLLFEAQENPSWAEKSDIDDKTRIEHFYWLGLVIDRLNTSNSGKFVANKITRKITHDRNPSDFWLEDNPLSLTSRVVLKDKEIILDELEKYLNGLSDETLNKATVKYVSSKLPIISEEDTSKQRSSYNNKVRFDTKSSTLMYGNRSCDIPDETLEHYVCKLAFKNRKVAAKEDDILENTVKSQSSQRAVYDAMLRVNEKASKKLDIDKLLTYKAAKIRINKKYQ